MDDFLWRALVAGLGVAVVAGPLGCFVVWRRMAYFGDALGHSALLGVAAGIAFGIDVTVGVVAVCLAAALIFLRLPQATTAGRQLAPDTALGIIASGALAAGLIVATALTDVRVDLMGFLFGDILAVAGHDVVAIWLAAAVVLGVLVVLWRPLLAVAVHEELAAAEGVAVARVQLAFVMALALTVAVAMKIVGVMLITALLIVPAAAARPFAATPRQMAAVAAALGAAAVAAGLVGSLWWDVPTGAAIVGAAVILFVLSRLVPGRLTRSG